MSRRNTAIPESVRNVAKAARRAGWTITVLSSGHLAWTSPLGYRVVSSASPSDFRAIRNLRQDLRLGGLDIDVSSKCTPSKAKRGTGHEA
ncbi:MAG: hypothetical protein M3O41_00425 [Pseudomonadota bacterium]|nr:hypothetical protein [Pseudomonadota bacterium]